MIKSAVGFYLNIWNRRKLDMAERQARLRTRRLPTLNVEDNVVRPRNRRRSETSPSAQSSSTWSFRSRSSHLANLPVNWTVSRLCKELKQIGMELPASMPHKTLLRVYCQLVHVNRRQCIISADNDNPGNAEAAVIATSSEQFNLQTESCDHQISESCGRLDELRSYLLRRLRKAKTKVGHHLRSFGKKSRSCKEWWQRLHVN